MHSLAEIRAKAQASANRDGKPVVILNLNRFSPIYVVRQDWERADASSSFVERVWPSTEGVAP